MPLDIAIPSSHRSSVSETRSETKVRSLPSHSQDLGTRNVCIVTVIFAFFIGVVSIAAGTRIIMFPYWTAPNYLINTFISMGNTNYPFVQVPGYIFTYISGHRILNLPKTVMLLTSLLLNIALTSLFDGMNLVLSVTLRWILFQEGNVVFNSNSRLFTSSQKFGPCHWTINILSTIALVLGYGATSILATNIYVISMVDSETATLNNDPITGPRYALDFNAWSMLGLGFALLLQSGICIWALIFGKHIVRNWSSNTLGTAHAYVCAEFESALTWQKDPNLPWYSRRSFIGPDSLSTGRGERSLHSKSSSSSNSLEYGSSKPRRQQPSASACVPLTRRLANVVWTIFVALTILVLVVAITAKKTGSCSAEWVLNSAYRTDFLAYWQTYCQVMIPYVNLDAYFFVERRDWLGLLIQSLGFAIISLGLHCVELLTEVMRDEYTWRRATTTGADPGAGALAQRMSNGPCWILFVFKCVTSWLFGYAYTANLWLYMNLLPLCALVFVFLLLALFCEHLIRHQPKGPQPAAYGNLHKLAIFVDEWEHERLFWGDKGEISDKVRKCGTAGQRLAEVDMEMRYSGLRAR
jgi:hypothetical protein